MLMSGQDGDQKKENALKTSLDYVDGFLGDQSYAAGDEITIADFSILSSLTQLEVMDYSVSSYRYAYRYRCHYFRWRQKCTDLNFPHFFCQLSLKMCGRQQWPLLLFCMLRNISYITITKSSGNHYFCKTSEN
jgi:hypothetical protein